MAATPHGHPARVAGPAASAAAPLLAPAPATATQTLRTYARHRPQQNTENSGLSRHGCRGGCRAEKRLEDERQAAAVGSVGLGAERALERGAEAGARGGTRDARGDAPPSERMQRTAPRGAPARPVRPRPRGQQVAGRGKGSAGWRTAPGCSAARPSLPSCFLGEAAPLSACCLLRCKQFANWRSTVARPHAECCATYRGGQPAGCGCSFTGPVPRLVSLPTTVREVIRSI